MKIRVDVPSESDISRFLQCPVWEAPIGELEWHYDAKEVCYLLDGEVVVTTPEGTRVAFRAGDMVSFPAGLSCRWQITKPVRKHYRFE